jgi:hypothetical protein
MCCLGLSVVFFGPRFAFALLWIFDTTRINAAFSTVLWPILGLLFAPWTVLAYALMWGPVHGVSGFGWVIVGLGVVIDLMTYSARAAARNRFQT